MQHMVRATGLLLLFILPMSGYAAEGVVPAAANGFNPAISLILSGWSLKRTAIVSLPTIPRVIWNAAASPRSVFW